MKKPIFILGSARSEGKTSEVLEKIVGGYSAEIVDLNKLNISPYDYEHKNKEDDYIPLMRRVLEHDIMVLATPVYWYSVSTIMKIFIDRITDLITIEKGLGRRLRGKKLFVITTYSTSKPQGFEYPIEQFCNYLGIEYLGCSYICSNDPSPLSSNNNSEIDKAKKILFA